MMTLVGWGGVVRLSPPQAEMIRTTTMLAAHVNATRTRLIDVSFFISLCYA
jgi:hypothetical protein